MIKFAGLDFHLLNKTDALKDHGKLLFIVTANAEIIVKANEDKKFKGLLSNAHCTFDGQIPLVLARMQNKGRQIEKISGSDFIYDVCQLAEKEKRKVFLLGGAEESNRVAQMRLKEKYRNLEIAGMSPPFAPYPFASDINSMIQSHIKEFSPDYVFVGFGAGKQEAWINDHYQFLSDLNVRMIVGSGGTFEFVSGKIRRAPRFIQKIGMEGVFRFVVEPKIFRLNRLLKSFKIFYYAFTA